MLQVVLRYCGAVFLCLGMAIAEEDPTGDDVDKPKWDVGNPPGAWHSIEIDTRTTTWTNLDVSPDGQTLVFDMLGDLYTVSLEGGEAAALTSGIAWNMQPRFSPDGNEIAFVSDRNGADNLWVMPIGGGDARELTSERKHLFHNPAWSPDGQWIAARKGFVSTRSIPAGEIWLVHAGGGQGVRVVERPNAEKDQKNIAEPAFSPDGRYLYYSQDITPGTGWQYNKNALESVFAIKRLDRETGKTVSLVSGPGGAIRPVPSPDGKWLAFVKRLPDTHSALYLMDLRSGNQRPLNQKLDRDLQETNGAHGNTPAFAWTPDSGSLVFWAGGRLHRQSIEAGSEPASLDVHVNTQRRVRTALRYSVEVAPEEIPVRALRWAQYSPDGKKVVFQALGYLYIRDVASGEQVRLTRQTDHFEFWPSFSADGRSIVYTTWDDQELGSVRTIATRGGRSRVVTEYPGHYVEPRFSPDGESISYRKFSGGNLLSPRWSAEPGLYVAQIDGDDPVKVSDAGFNAQFSADGQRLLFSETVNDTELVLKSVNLRGHDEKTHIKGARAIEFSLSPDGRWIAFIEHFNAHVAPFALTGQTVDVARDSKAFPVSRVAARSGEGLHWSADSSTLHWALGATLYSRRLDEAFDILASEDELPDPVSEGLELDFSVSATTPSGTVALTNARIVTLRDADRFEEVIQQGTVVVEGNRIAAVGPADEVEIPETARVLDAAGMTIIPGLIDVHAHGAMADAEITPQQNWQQFSNLAFGVTTIHDPSNDTSEIFAHAEMQRTGQVLGPRTWSTGTILYGALVPAYTAIIDSLDDARFHVRRLKDMGAISVKSYNQLRRDSRQQVIAAAAEMQMMVLPEGGAKFQHNLTHVVDGHTGVEHALPVAHIYDDVVGLWSQTDVGYSPTFGVAYGGLSGETYWYDRTEVWRNPRLLRYTPLSRVLPGAIRRLRAPDHHYNHVEVARHAKTLRGKGVPVVIGAHGQREGLAAHWEMWMMAQGGFTPWQAIRGATLDGARYLGMDSDIGSIEAGKLADLVLIDGNPLADLRRSEYVAYTMINGRLFAADTMNEHLSGDFEREPFFFESEGGDAFPIAAQAALERKAQVFGWRH